MSSPACARRSLVISKRNGRVLRHAKDPITAAMTLDEMVWRDWGNTASHVLCLGAGGAGVAITLGLLQWILTRAHHPHGHRHGRLDAARTAHEHAPTVVALEYQAAGQQDAGRLLSELPPGSLIINATGMDKDRPGSPLPPGAAWLDEGIESRSARPANTQPAVLVISPTRVSISRSATAMASAPPLTTDSYGKACVDELFVGDDTVTEATRQATHPMTGRT
jgi:hypothetical protein